MVPAQGPGCQLALVRSPDDSARKPANGQAGPRRGALRIARCYTAAVARTTQSLAVGALRSRVVGAPLALDTRAHDEYNHNTKGNRNHMFTYLKTYSSLESARAAALDLNIRTQRQMAVRRDGGVWLACPLDDRGYDSQGTLVEVVGERNRV